MPFKYHKSKSKIQTEDENQSGELSSFFDESEEENLGGQSEPTNDSIQFVEVSEED